MRQSVIVKVKRELSTILPALVAGTAVYLTLSLSTRIILASLVTVVVYLLGKYLTLEEVTEDGTPVRKKRLPLGDFIVAAGYFLAIVLILVIPNRESLYQPDWSQIPFTSYLRVLAALSLVYFFPGYAIVHTIDRKRTLPYGIAWVFAFIVSYFLTTLVVFVLAATKLGFEGFQFVFVILNLALLAMYVIFEVRRSDFAPEEKLYPKSKEFLSAKLVLLSLGVLIFIGILLINFKYHDLVRGDLYNHFGSALAYFKPGWYEWWVQVRYPYWFHFNLVAYLKISGFPLVNATMLTNFLLIVSIPAFYAMSKEFLKNRRMAILATVSYFLFSGFSFLFVLQQKLPLITVNEQTWWQMLENIRPYTLFREHPFLIEWVFKPHSIGLLAFIVLLYLLKAKVSSVVKLSVGAISFATAYFVHVYEMPIFLIVLAVALLVYGNKRMGDIKWLIWAALSGALLVFALDRMATQAYSGLALYGTLAFSLVLLIAAYFPVSKWVKVVFTWPKKLVIGHRRRYFGIALIYILWGLFFLAISVYRFTYPFDADWLYWFVGDFPWFFWPVKYGIPLVLALITITVLLKRQEYDRDLMFLFGSFVALILFGRLIGYLNIKFYLNPLIIMGVGAQGTPLFEWRVVWLAFVFLALLSGWSLQLIANKLRTLKLSTSLVRTSLLSFIVLIVTIGSMDNLLLIERNSLVPNYWEGTSLDIEASDFLRQNNPPSYKIVTYSMPEAINLQLTQENSLGDPYQRRILYNVKRDSFFNNQYMASTSYFLSSHGGKYLPLTKDDVASVKNLKESWFNKYLFPFLPVAFENAKYSIYQAPPLSRMVPNPEVALVVPWTTAGAEKVTEQKLVLSPESTNIYSVMMLALAQTNYGVFAYGDPAQFNSPVIMLTYDPLQKASLKSKDWHTVAMPPEELRLGAEPDKDLETVLSSWHFPSQPPNFLHP